MTNHVRSVFLIRHGRTSYNAAHKLQGQVDIPLDAVGEWQVKQTAAALKRLYVDRRQEINHRFIVCSDLKRAHATAQAFADVLGGIEPVDDRRVRERSFGDWDGHAVAELAERYPEDFRSWMESRGGELKYGAEPKEAVGKRGVEALEDWSTRAGDDTDLFVAPVEVGDNVTTGAGSVVRHAVPSDTMVYSENTQHNVEGWKPAWER